MGPHLGRLGQDGGVYIADQIMMFFQDPADFPHQHQGIRSLVSGIRIREELADVAQSRGAQQGVHNGMAEHIRVGVAQKSFLVGNIHAAHDQFSAFHQTVDIISCTYSHALSFLSRAERLPCPVFSICLMTIYCANQKSQNQYTYLSDCTTLPNEGQTADAMKQMKQIPNKWANKCPELSRTA